MVFHCVLFDFSLPYLDDHFLDPDPHPEGRDEDIPVPLRFVPLRPGIVRCRVSCHHLPG